MTFIDTLPDPFASVQTLLLIIGNARSGSTLVGSVIDAHPQAVIANETTASATFWRDTSRATILGEIQENSRRNRESGRQSEGYTYQVKKETDSGRSLTVMGDKIWNPATLLLHGDHRLLDRLHEMLGIPIKIVHATPKQTRASVLWQPEEVQLVLDGIARFDFLSRYATEAYSLSHP